MEDEEVPADTHLHCWEAGPDADDGCGTTCMLMSGHAGPHDWSRDDEIVLAFR